MIFKSSKQLIAGTTAAALCVTAVTMFSAPILSSYATSDQDEQYYIDGYHYEFYNMSCIGECSFEPDKKGGFTADWQGIGQCHFAKGLLENEMPGDPESIIINYDLNFSPVVSEDVPEGNSFVGAYGWLIPQSSRYNIEYTIVDYQCNFDPVSYAKNMEMENIGSYEIDGITYDLYNSQADDAALNSGTEKFLSFRHGNIIGSGASVTLKSSIDVTKHMAEWEKLGMEQSRVYSTMLDIQAWKSNGSAVLNSCEISITEKEREAFPEDGYFYKEEYSENYGAPGMKPLGKGGFEAKWGNTSDATFIKGKSFAAEPVKFSSVESITVDYDLSGSFSKNEIFDASVHGWMDIPDDNEWKDEFYVVINRQNYFFPVNFKDGVNNENVVEIGKISDNGVDYTLYRSIPLHSWGDSGLNEPLPFARYTYWSVPENYCTAEAGKAAASGRINLKKHLEKYMEAASQFEQVNELSEITLKLFSMNGEGKASVNKFNVNVEAKYSDLGNISYYSWGNVKNGNYNITPNGTGGFTSSWDEEQFKSFTKQLDSSSELNVEDFSVAYDAAIDMDHTNDTEWAVCASCKSAYSNLEYYVFESYGESSVNYADDGMSLDLTTPYSFLKNHAILKKNTAIIDGIKYDIYYLRYKLSQFAIGGYDIYRCVSVKHDAAVKLGSAPVRISGNIDWGKHIMAWDSAGFPTTSVDQCEVFFETNSPKGTFDLSTCNFKVNADENTKSEKEVVKGDFNGDGYVDTFDLVACRKAIVGLYKGSYDPKAADLNDNGKFDVADIILLSRFVLGSKNT